MREQARKEEVHTYSRVDRLVAYSRVHRLIASALPPHLLACVSVLPTPVLAGSRLRCLISGICACAFVFACLILLSRNEPVPCVCRTAARRAIHSLFLPCSGPLA